MKTNRDVLAEVIREVLLSHTHADRTGQPCNLTDALLEIASAIRQAAAALEKTANYGN